MRAGMMYVLWRRQLRRVASFLKGKWCRVYVCVCSAITRRACVAGHRGARGEVHSAGDDGNVGGNGAEPHRGLE